MTNGLEPAGFDPIPMARPVAATPSILCDPPHPILLMSISRPRALADLGVFIGLFLALDLTAQFAAWGLGYDQQSWLLPATVIRTFIVIAIILTILVSRGQPIASVGISGNRLGANVLLGLATLVASFAVYFGVVFPLVHFWPAYAEQMMDNTEFLDSLLGGMEPSMLVLMMALVGIYEELIFRGFIMTRLRRVTNSWTLAAVISVVLFTAPHALDQQAAALVPLGLLAILWSVITIWRRSLVPVIIAHFLFNTAQGIGLYVLREAQAT